MSTIKDLLLGMRKLRDGCSKWCSTCSVNQERLEKALLVAVEALQNAELSFMGMGNATIEYGLPSKPEELIAMCEDRSKRIQSFFADIEAALSGDEK